MLTGGSCAPLSASAGASPATAGIRIVPTPSIGPRLLLGREGEREVALASQRVAPTRLAELGHEFRYPHLELALRHLLGRTVDAA